MKRMLVTVLLLLAILIAPNVHAGQFNISKVWYKTASTSDGNSTVVWVGAEARYVGVIDAADRSWSLQTQLVALGSLTQGIRYGAGIPVDGVIDNKPESTYGATRTIPNCKVLDSQPQSYHGDAIVAIYHQGYDPEVGYGSAEWAQTTCTPTPGSGSGTGGGGSDGGSLPGPSDGTGSPILIDLDRGGFDLTGFEDGVDFDIDRDGVPNRLAWTSSNSGDGWLAFDRNGNGLIDDGGELFGNFTDQPKGDELNGYRALAILDSAEEGGDGNGIIDDRDSAFGQLLVWLDTNRDGVSQSTELRDLASLGIQWLDTRTSTSRRRDQHGNEFRYQALVRTTRGMTHSVDVFLVMQP